MDNNDKILLDANRQIDELKEKLNSLEKEKYRYDKKIGSLRRVKNLGVLCGLLTFPITIYFILMTNLTEFYNVYLMTFTDIILGTSSFSLIGNKIRYTPVLEKLKDECSYKISLTNSQIKSLLDKCNQYQTDKINLVMPSLKTDKMMGISSLSRGKKVYRRVLKKDN